MGTTTKRLPNTQPNEYAPALIFEAFLNGEDAGAIKVPQEADLSKAGNVLYLGRIPRGLQFQGDPQTVLQSLTFKVNGVEANVSSKGVHLSEPRVFPVGHARAGQIMPGTGGQLLVCHTVTVEPKDGVAYMVMIIVRRLAAKVVKGELVDQGYSLKVNAFPQGAGFAAATAIGEISGFLVEA